ncbi:MAG: hypothetical protein ABIG44_18910 [Planctomycetota bacterium]
MKCGRLSWLTKLPPATKRTLDAQIDADVDTARTVYDRLKIVYYCPFSTFQKYFTRRRRERDARREDGKRPATGQAVDLVEIERDLLISLQVRLTSGTLRASLLKEIRLFLAELRKRGQQPGGRP